MQLADIMTQLAAWFPPEAHKERKLRGGGKWFYLPHQTIRDRLNEICPNDWSDEFKGPFLSGNETIMICRLTICGVTREGVADNKVFPELNDEGKEKIIGSPVVNAARHAFRDAAEQFGVGAYLDDQKTSRDRFVRYMQKKGDGRAYKAAYDNGWVEGSTKPSLRQPEKPANLLQVMSAPEDAISLEQQRELWAIARASGYTDDGVRAVFAIWGYASTAQVKNQHFEAIVGKLKDKNLVQMYNSRFKVTTEP